MDILGRVWTARRVLLNRSVQVRFLSHLPLAVRLVVTTMRRERLLALYLLHPARRIVGVALLVKVNDPAPMQIHL
jgi:hypothetical protein